MTEVYAGQYPGNNIIFDTSEDMITCIRMKISKNIDFPDVEKMIFQGHETIQFYQQLFNSNGSLKSEGWSVALIDNVNNTYQFMMVGPYISYEYDEQTDAVRYFFCLDEIDDEGFPEEPVKVINHRIELNEVSATPIIVNLRNTFK